MIIKLPAFYACPKKIEARQETIINQYQKHFYDALPENKQYWTQCGIHANDDGVFQQGSELGQMLSKDFIKTEQFYGVDIEPTIIEKNSLSKPEAIWICDDFLTAMKKHYGSGKTFNPAIVNADLLYMKNRGVYEASKIITFLTQAKVHDIMLVVNLMLSNPHGYKMNVDMQKDPLSIIDEFSKNNNFQFSYNQGWKLNNEYYVYNGTGARARTIMCTFIFIKK